MYTVGRDKLVSVCMSLVFKLLSLAGQHQQLKMREREREETLRETKREGEDDRPYIEGSHV